jgi:hypothetical protein
VPATVTVLRGGADNGRHLWLLAPAKLETFSLAAGVQVRALAKTGRPMQCVAPPSIHPDTGRAYRFAEGGAPGEVEIAPMPTWMLDMLPRPASTGSQGGERQPADRWVAMLRDGLVESKPSRNCELTALVGHWLGHGLNAYEVLELAYLVNAHRCRPPLPEKTVLTIVRSVCQRDLLKRGL